MDDELKRITHKHASGMGLAAVAPGFYEKLAWYLRTPAIAARPQPQKAAVAAYLVSAAIRIAHAEGKKALESEDLKAAIWYFHTPVDENDPCVRASDRIMEIEEEEQQQRGPVFERLPGGQRAPRFKLEPELRAYVNTQSKTGGGLATGAA